MFVAEEMEDTLVQFVPHLVRRRIDAGQSSGWIAEYRRVFIMFCKLPAIDYADLNVLSLLQNCVRAVQEVCDSGF